MAIQLKHVEKRRGVFGYRRRVPRDLQDVIGKKEFTKTLGKTYKEALANYQLVHAEVDRVINMLKPKMPTKKTKKRPYLASLSDLQGTTKLPPEISLGANLRGSPCVHTGTFGVSNVPLNSPSEIHREAKRQLREIGFSLTEGFGLEESEEESLHREATSEQLTLGLPIDEETGHAIIEDPLTIRLLQLINGGPSRPRFSVALDFYIEENVRGTHDEGRKITRFNHVLDIVVNALGRDPYLDDSFKRADGRTVRDNLLESVSPATTKRYLNDATAVVKCAIDQLDLTDFPNPFNKHKIPSAGLSQDKRKPFTNSQLVDIRGQIQARARLDLQLIWRLLAGTGCRIAEITGLLVEDVVLEGESPHIALRFHPHRRLMNGSSIRMVPLVGGALWAA